MGPSVVTLLDRGKQHYGTVSGRDFHKKRNGRSSIPNQMIENYARFRTGPHHHPITHEITVLLDDKSERTFLIDDRLPIATFQTTIATISRLAATENDYARHMKGFRR